jgi:hypothetical protein
MNDAVQRAEIQRYVQKAFLAKIMQMNEVRHKKTLELRGELARRGSTTNSSAWMIGAVDIEEECLADLLRQKADLYLDAYSRKGLKILPDVLKDISFSQVELTAARKGALMGEAKLTAMRTHHHQDANAYAHLGKKASVAMMEIAGKIDLYNLTPQKAEPMTVNNISYHLSGVGNRVVHGDDNSVNIINEAELFDRLAAVITSSIDNEHQRQELLDLLDALKNEKHQSDYLTKLTRFVAAAASIGHLIAPYLPGLTEKAASLL